MAIKGTLAEIPLPELIRILERRTGKLNIKTLPQSDHDLYLDQARLKAIYIDGEVLKDKETIREIITNLSKIREGNYTFKAVSKEELPQSCDVALRLLLLKLTGVDEVTLYKDRLPAAQTRFKRSNSKKVETWPDESLKKFWLTTIFLFAKSCSAEEIARKLNLDLEQTRLNLHKLRCLGQISPVRSFEAKLPYVDSSITPSTQKSKLSIEKLLIENANNMSYQEILNNLKEPEKPTPLKERRRPNRSPINKGLASRLLRALSKRKGDDNE